MFGGHRAVPRSPASRLGTVRCMRETVHISSLGLGNWPAVEAACYWAGMNNGGFWTEPNKPDRLYGANVIKMS